MIKIDFNDDLLKMLLEIYSELTGLPIILYINQKIIHSTNKCPDFCIQFNNLMKSEKYCCIHESNIPLNGLFQCQAGLWCYSIPIKIDGNIIGIFILGHRRIYGRENESKIYLDDLAKKILYKVDKNKFDLLYKFLEKVELINEDELNEIYLFRWDEIPGEDNEKLINFLIQNFNIQWVKTAQIEKKDDDRTIRVYTKNNSLLIELHYEKTKANLKIDDGRTDEFIVKTGRKLIYYESQLNKISFITKYLTVECQRAISEKKRESVWKENTVNLAHYFLLPIQSLIADAENIYNEIEDKSELKTISEDLLLELIKLSYIAENIRGIVLGVNDNYGYEFHQVEIYPIIQDTIKLFNKEAKKKGIIIENPIIKDIPFPIIEISKPHIKQVFFNVIHNAIKYSFTDKTKQRFIKIICYSQKNYYCVKIMNYGVGISPLEMEEGLIFQQGYRGLQARDRSRTGSGAGLSIVKKIVELHNGNINIESEMKGFGTKIDPHLTTVTICLPFTQPRRS